MARHIFLTGEKQVGKSTLLQKFLEQYSGTVGGFRTIRTNAYLKDSYSVHMFRLDEAQTPNESNLLFICGKPDQKISERFNRLGYDILSQCVGCSLIIMDELGPHEAEAVLFHAAVLKLLDDSIPVLGVLQAPADLFWADIVAHERVQILEITKDNRAQEKTMEAICSVFSFAPNHGK